jgi:hypothetical protein
MDGAGLPSGRDLDVNLFQIIGQIFKPATELIDNLHTSDEERLTLKAQNLSTYAEPFDVCKCVGDGAGV